MRPQRKSASLRTFEIGQELLAGMFRFECVRYAIVGQRQSNGTEPESIRELYQFIGKVEAFPLSFFFTQRFLEATLIRLYIFVVETFSKTRAVQRYKQFGMIAGAMQALPVIFYDQ